MSCDPELTREYREALGSLIEHLEKYVRQLHVSWKRKIEPHVRVLSNLYVDCYNLPTSLALVEIMQQVDQELCDVYFEQEGFERLQNDWDDLPATVSREANRLKHTLPGLGYEAIYTRFGQPLGVGCASAAKF